MSQVGKLRRTVIGWAHYCPGCREMHVIPNSWTFNDDALRPTFAPSVKVNGVRHDRETGEHVQDARGRPIPFQCHYHLLAGVLHYHADCTHALRSTKVPLPPLPAWADNDVLFK